MNINDHPIYKNIYDLCQEIEKFPASPQQTKVVIMAGELEKPAAALLSDLKVCKEALMFMRENTIHDDDCKCQLCVATNYLSLGDNRLKNMTETDYLFESLKSSFEEHNVDATEEQIRSIAKHVQVSIECKSQAFYTQKIL